MLSGVTIVCFASSYAIAFLLELSRVLGSGVRAAVVLVITAAGLFAHTAFLYYRALAAVGAPLSSEKDWYLLAAWVLVVVYLCVAIVRPKVPFGLFLLPLALGLIGAARYLASETPLARQPAAEVWGAIHAVFIMLAAVSVLVGFVAGLMYLGQVRHLKAGRPLAGNLRLPSLEWLRRANSRALSLSLAMLGVGVLAGMVLNRIGATGAAPPLPWNDPVVLSTLAMFVWLAAAVGLQRLLSPGAPGAKSGLLDAHQLRISGSSPGGRPANGKPALGTHGERREERGEVSRGRTERQTLATRNDLLSIMRPDQRRLSISLLSPLSSLPCCTRRPAMLVQVVGCSHHGTSIAVRERLAFTAEETREALDHWRRVFPGVEAVVLSTCNRVEIYAATERAVEPTLDQIATFLARFHGIDPAEVIEHLYHHSEEPAVRHLFTVAASLDSMVLGEPQILAQVKQAYQVATEQDNTGPLLHAVFQAALRVARRVASETAIHRRHVSIPSVAVADFARQIFERFDDKHALVIGAGEMAEETLGYLAAEGTASITVVNRCFDHANALAARWQGRAVEWQDLPQALRAADLVLSTTAAGEPVVTLEEFRKIEAERVERPMLILDLAVPRDFEPAICDLPDVYLYSIDDLQAACQRNRAERDKELPAAMHIIDQETARFMAEMYHRAISPVIEQLRFGWQRPKEDELQRLLNKLPDVDDRAKDEIRRSFDRLVNKLLHPPLESLRDESRNGVPRGLLDALARLFQLKD